MVFVHQIIVGLTRARGRIVKTRFGVFPGCVNDAEMSGNTSKLVFGPPAISVMDILTTPHSGLVNRQNHMIHYFCVHLKNVTILLVLLLIN